MIRMIQTAALLILIQVCFFVKRDNVNLSFYQEKTSTKRMMFGDTTRLRRPFAKDPHVIWFGGRYLMYYSVPGFTDQHGKVTGWGIGIAESDNLVDWRRIGEVNADPEATYEEKGFAAPCALVTGKNVNLFYQTYGNGRNDAICHATSTDGIHFTRNKTNPIFHPDGKWNCGRAIDAEVVHLKANIISIMLPAIHPIRSRCKEWLLHPGIRILTVKTGLTCQKKDLS